MTSGRVIAFLRSTCGLVVVLLMMVALRKPFQFRAVPWPAMVLMAIINTAVPWALIAFSEQRITSGMASIFNATTPVWTVVVGMLFFRGKSGRLQWAGLGIATIGMIRPAGRQARSAASIDGIGLLGMLVAACCYAVGVAAVQAVVRSRLQYVSDCLWHPAQQRGRERPACFYD